MSFTSTNHEDQRYSWLAERNGIAVAEINSKLEFFLNTHAQIIFGLSNAEVDFETLSEKITGAEDFKQFLLNLNEISSEYHLSVPQKGIDKKYLATGIKPRGASLADITLQPFESDHNNAEYLCQYATNSNDVFAFWDKDLQLIYVNRNFEVLFERSRKELNGNPFAEMQWIHPDDKNTLPPLDHDRELSLEFRLIMPDGNYKWIWYQRKPLYQKDSSIYRYLGVYTDISARKNVELEMQNNQKMERLVLEISSRFISMPYNTVDENIQQALKDICLFTDTNSAHLYRYNLQYDTIALTHFYSETNQIISQVRDIPFSIQNWHFKEITKNQFLQVSHVSQITKDDPIRQHCEKVKIGSFIDIALSYQNRIHGFFGLTCIAEGRNWSDYQIQLLQIMGNLFMNALQRRDYMTELLDSEQNYREIFNATTEAIFIHHPETGAIEDVNSAMLKMFQISYESALESDIKDLSGDIDGQKANAALDRIHKAMQEPQFFEWLMKKSNGETFWTEVTLKKAEIHGSIKVIAVVRDISDRRKAEQLLRESEANYRMIIEGQNDLILKLDSQWDILFASPSFDKSFQHRNKDMKTKNFRSFVLESETELVTIALQKLFRAPHTCFFELPAETVNGIRWFAWNFSGISNEAEQKNEFIGVGRDITYQKMVESALRESEERFRSIVQNLSDVVFLLDEAANIRYVTPSCEQYLGLNVEFLLGNNLYNLIHPDDIWLAKENLALHLEGSDYSLPYEIKLMHDKDKWRVFEAKSNNLLNHPAVNSIIFTISDITERKQMEKQVLDAIIKTEEKERERFAKDLHDDLGPLLSSVKMYVGMLKKVEKKEKQDFILSNLQEIVKEAIATTKDVSNDLNPHVLNNYGLISALRLFVEKISQQTPIKFTEDIGDARYSVAIELSLYRIAKELINNSLKHAEASQLKLSIHEKGAFLCLDYEDNGKGLSEEILKTSKPGGMGLSNIISRAKSLNAKHTFHANLNKGFKFELQVPLTQEQFVLNK